MDFTVSKSMPESFSQSIPGYLEVCLSAAEDPRVFEKFKSNVQYRTVLEHVSYNLADSYIDLLPKDLLYIVSGSKFKEKFNSLGQPDLYKFGALGVGSPSFFRYLKVYSDLIKYFGSLDTLKICEIGGGYGGQAALILEYSQVNTYTIIDLPEVNLLSKKFISNMRGARNHNIRFVDPANLVEESGDLLISNYALSEVSRSQQIMYLKNVVSNFKKGYITWNDLSEKNYGGLSLNDCQLALNGADILQEKPLTAPNNKIIVWGN